jgi:hypothetical protein
MPYNERDADIRHLRAFVAVAQHGRVNAEILRASLFGD